jgi:subtilisin-like proprotein convertase family protein
MEANGVSPAASFTVTSVDFVLNFNSPPNPVAVSLYAFPAGTAVPTMAGQLLVGSAMMTAPVSFGNTLVTVPFPETTIVPAGMELYVTTEAASNGFGGSIFASEGGPFGGIPEVEPSYVFGCPSLGLFPDYTDVDGFFPGYSHMVQVNGATLDPMVPVIPDAGNPYMSGDLLPIGGPYDFIYTAEDLSGNVSTCEFSILVQEFPEDEQITALACNDEVQISLDENCSVTLGADMILEGGPYGCYDTYSVTVEDNWGQPVDADPSAPGTQLGPNEVDSELVATVTDTDTGNSCWGTLFVEDKQIPPLQCSSFDLGCDTDPVPGSEVSLPVSATFPDVASQDNSEVEETVDVETLPGATVTDVNVSIVTDHTWVGDVVIRVTAPNGTEVELLDNWNNAGICGGCAGNGLDVVFDDEASLTQADLGATCNNNPAAEGSYQPKGNLSDLDGQLAAGTWTITVGDVCGGDGGTFTASLSIGTEGGMLPFPLPAGTNYSPTNFPDDFTGPWTLTNFDPCGDAQLEYVDILGQESCDGEYGKTVYRVWTATDESGNTTTCTDTFNFLRSSISDLTLPPNYDGLPGNEPPLSCDAVFATDEEGHPDPSVTGGPGGAGCWNISGNYDDIEIPICGGNSNSYKYLRQWVILDWCTGEVANHNQIIKVVDFTAPEVDVDEVVEVSTGVWGCEYTLNLNDLGVSISDNCDDDVEVNVVPPAGTDLPKGNHDITIQALDDCGNLTEVIVQLSVVDLVPPIIVVDDEIRITLTQDGTGKAFVETFDEGSFDGCGPIQMEVRRVSPNPCFLTTDWGPYVEFCCADVPISPVVVQFRALDHSGNSNTGWINVTVEDKLPPAILCPPDVEVSCLDDYQTIIDNAGVALEDIPQSVIEVTGVPQYGSACASSVVYTVNGNVNECGVGTLNLTWIVTTESGLSNGCLQRIFVIQEAQNRLECDDISFPAGSPEAITYGPLPWCEVNDNQNDPDDDQPAIQITDCGDATITAPELDNDELCTAIGISMTADTFNFAGGACKKIVVHWEVIDHCIFDENYVNEEGEIDPFDSGNGYFEFFAEYDIFDNEGPEVECIEEYVVDCTETFSGPITAGASDNCSDPSAFGWSWQIDAGNNGTIDGQGVGASITASMLGLPYFPFGEHRVVWNVNDGCGNNTNQVCVFTISQEDVKAPTPYCYDGLSTAVMLESGAVTLWATDFDAGSFDNCDADPTVTMIPESDAANSNDPWADSEAGWTFDCTYIPNGVTKTFEVRIYVTDNAGNYDYCSATLRIDDNLDGCVDDPDVTANVAGRLSTESGLEVDLAEVGLSSTHPEYPEYTDSDASGSYEFVENPMYYNYAIGSSRDFGYLDGVSTLDLVLIQKYILGLGSFDSAYKVIAADINGDANVSAIDLVQLRKLILGLYENDDLPTNESWRFVDAKQEFADINNPWPIDEEITIDELDQHMMDQNFVAVKIGDVNSSIQLGFNNSQVRTGEAMSLEVLESNVIAGDLYKVEFSSKDFEDVFGYQFTLNFDASVLKYAGIESGALEMNESNFGLNRLSEGVLTTSWNNVEGKTVSNDETLFTLVFQGVNKGQLSQALSLNSRVTPAEAYRGSDLDQSSVSLVFRTDAGVVESNVIELYQNEPNPFDNETVIGFNLPEGGNAVISVYDVTGKVLKVIDSEFAKGFNTIKLNKSELGASGVLYYQLESGDFNATKKMIILE